MSVCVFTTKTGVAHINLIKPQSYHFSNGAISPLYRAVKGCFESWHDKQPFDVKKRFNHRRVAFAIHCGVQEVIEHLQFHSITEATSKELLSIDFESIFEIASNA